MKEKHRELMKETWAERKELEEAVENNVTQSDSFGRKIFKLF